MLRTGERVSRNSLRMAANTALYFVLLAGSLSTYQALVLSGGLLVAWFTEQVIAPIS